MTVKEIVEEYLRAHGYDGLYLEYCRCSVDNLIPCRDYAGNCEAGMKRYCLTCAKGPGCERESKDNFCITKRAEGNEIGSQDNKTMPNPNERSE